MKWIIIIVAFLIIIALLPDTRKSNNEDPFVSTIEKSTDNKIDIRPIESALLEDINDLDKFVKPMHLEPTEIDMNAFYSHINGYVKTIKRSDTSNVPEIKVLRKKLESSLRSFQSSKLKELRKTYAANAKQKLWEEDVDVKISADTKTLTLTGYIFAANKRKKQVYDGIHTILEMLRFNRLIMRFSEHSEYTYYDIAPPKDSDLKGIDFTY